MTVVGLKCLAGVVYLMYCGTFGCIFVVLRYCAVGGLVVYYGKGAAIWSITVGWRLSGGRTGKAVTLRELDCSLLSWKQT
ncbi:hypothetical protein chiPu_0011242 [Chiloscyllium punctatum]|uniref:Uncharacterized protein n=1 Tax=Chiloscyllium punctatum TaxID=137246 RepID=A0A401SQW5_CHIPU|nr:hypothetical protein [Chiloscyllium punctatum]